jgi:hypothetical protein
MPERYEYKVVEVRERMIGGKMSGGKLEKLLNEHASQGWRLRAITSADVKGSDRTRRDRGPPCHLRAPHRVGPITSEQIAVDVSSSSTGGRLIVPL